MRKSRLALLILVIFPFCLFTPGLFAKELKGQDARISSNRTPLASAIKLSIDDVTKLALANSLDIQIAKFDAYIKRADLPKAESVFDTFLNAQIEYDRNKQEPANTIVGSETKKISYSAGLEKKLPTGTDLTLDFSSDREETDSSFTTLNPQYEAAAELSLTQALGRNFFGLTDRADVKITKIDIENSGYSSLDDIETALSQAQKSYWNFVFKDEALAIKKTMLEKADKLYRIYEDKYSLGLAEKSELLAVEANLRARENDLAVAILEKETAKNNLLFLLNLGDFRRRVEPKDSLTCAVDRVDLYSALAHAIASRRDYKRIKNKLKKSKISLVVKKNALWPEIDLKATLIRNNLAESYSKAWKSLGGESNDEVILGLNFKIPVENREAKAELKKTRLKKERFLLSLKRTERLILQEVNDRVNKVNTVDRQIALFKVTVKIQRDKLKEEIKRLRSGRSTADNLIRDEEDLLQARISLAKAMADYRTALVDLESAKNTLLGRYWKGAL